MSRSLIIEISLHLLQNQNIQYINKGCTPQSIHNNTGKRKREHIGTCEYMNKEDVICGNNAYERGGTGGCKRWHGKILCPKHIGNTRVKVSQQESADTDSIGKPLIPMTQLELRPLD